MAGDYIYRICIFAPLCFDRTSRCGLYGQCRVFDSRCRCANRVFHSWRERISYHLISDDGDFDQPVYHQTRGHKIKEQS